MVKNLSAIPGTFNPFVHNFYFESAYVLYHEFQTGSPCLSFDIIKDDHDRSQSAYPATAYIVAGTMSRQKKDHLIVLKLSNMIESKYENDDDDEESEPDPGE